jgi:hypothetical protein
MNTRSALIHRPSEYQRSHESELVPSRDGDNLTPTGVQLIAWLALSVHAHAWAEILIVDGKKGFYLDADAAKWTTDTNIFKATGTPFSIQVLGLSLEELAAEKVLGWASKGLPKRYIDLACITRSNASAMNLDGTGELIVEKFERERQQRRYRQLDTPARGDVQRPRPDRRDPPRLGRSPAKRHPVPPTRSRAR